MLTSNFLKSIRVNIKTMKIRELVKGLEGIQTIKSVMTLLNVNERKAIYYIYRLRKQGYVKTLTTPNKTRVYHISFENKLKSHDYYDIINEYSPIKISPKEMYKIYGREVSVEETLIFAIKTKSFRTLLAALALFRYITNWSELYTLAKKNHVERQVGALYDMSRKIMRVRRMSKLFRKYALPPKDHEFQYVIEGFKSKCFEEIEQVWHIYLPFNKEDLEVYKK